MKLEEANIDRRRNGLGLYHSQSQIASSSSWVYPSLPVSEEERKSEFACCVVLRCDLRVSLRCLFAFFLFVEECLI